MTEGVMYIIPKAMVTTVFDKLIYNAASNVRAIDSYYQKEATNQEARADIIIDETTLAMSVPATVLLGLETRLAELRKVYEAKRARQRANSTEVVKGKIGAALFSYIHDGIVA